VMQFVLNELKKNWHSQKLGKQLHVWSSGFKALMTWHMADTLQESREACGGQGYKSENRIGPSKAEHDIALTFEGDNRILLQAVAKSMLPEFVRGVQNGGVFKGHFSYLNKRKSLQNANVDGMDVRSTEFAQIVMRRREAALFVRLSKQLDKKRRAGISAFESWNDSAVLVEETARAHTELLIVDTFTSVLDKLRDDGETEIAHVLDLCGALYVVHRVDQQPIFLRTRVLSPLVADRAHEAVLELSKELRSFAIPLVDSFGFPPHLLAPIAFDYVAHNSRARL
jgi:acyl-CoA oxidase